MARKAPVGKAVQRGRFAVLGTSKLARQFNPRPARLTEADGPMQLATLTSSGLGGWVFYDIEVTRLE